VARLARIDFITQFLSNPVMDAFIFGLAILVGVSQLNKLFCVSKGEGNTIQNVESGFNTNAGSHGGRHTTPWPLIA